MEIVTYFLNLNGDRYLVSLNGDQYLVNLNGISKLFIQFCLFL